MRDGNRDVVAELKELRLHGMAGAWSDLVAQGGGVGVDGSRWLIEHLLQAEGVDRAMRSVSYQMSAARFPAHRDLAGFDFEASKVDRALIDQLADLSFTEAAHNAVFIGGPGTGKTHLCTALVVAGITRHGERVRFYSTVDLVNALEREKAEGKAGRIAANLMRVDAVILDELGYLPFSQAGGTPVDNLSKPCPPSDSFAHRLHSLRPLRFMTIKSEPAGFYRGDRYSDAGGLDGGGAARQFDENLLGSYRCSRCMKGQRQERRWRARRKLVANRRRPRTGRDTIEIGGRRMSFAGPTLHRPIVQRIRKRNSTKQLEFAPRV